MAFVIERKEEKKKKNPETEIAELKEQLAAKDLEIASLKDQVELVQTAVDEIILGGML